jgi:hypothetical protein
MKRDSTYPFPKRVATRFGGRFRKSLKGVPKRLMARLTDDKRYSAFPFPKQTTHCLGFHFESFLKRGPKLIDAVLRTVLRTGGDLPGNNETKVLLIVSKKDGPLLFGPSRIYF